MWSSTLTMKAMLSACAPVSGGGQPLLFTSLRLASHWESAGKSVHKVALQSHLISPPPVIRSLLHSRSPQTRFCFHIATKESATRGFDSCGLSRPSCSALPPSACCSSTTPSDPNSAETPPLDWRSTAQFESVLVLWPAYIPGFLRAADCWINLYSDDLFSGRFLGSAQRVFQVLTCRRRKII